MPPSDVAPDVIGLRKSGAGTAFRVWAPHAESVHLTGSFNDWADPGVPLRREDGGHWSVRCDEAKAGERYQYRISHGGRSFLKTDPRARLIDPETGTGVIHHGDFDWGSGDFRPPPLNELVLYELHVGTFTPEGTFAGVISKLPYLADLGVNGIELMPVMEFPGETSWGYDLSDPFAVAARYGGPDGLKSLIRHAHEAGIAVILDVVYNHFGPKNLALWRFDGWFENDRGGIYFYNDERAGTPWGDTRPDFGRPEVRQYLRDNALMWITEFRADGLRIDGVSHLRTTKGPGRDGTANLPDGWNLLQWINKDLKLHSPHVIAIAEGHGPAEAVSRWIEWDGAGFDTQWEPNFSRTVRPVLEAPQDEQRRAAAIVSSVATELADPFGRVIYIEAHDEVANGKQRLPSQIDADHPASIWARRRTIQAAGILLTSPGLPLLFQGQEFLEDGHFDDRRRLDWEKAARHEGVRRAFRDLIRLRRNLSGTTRGLTGQHVDFHEETGSGPIIAWHRHFAGGPRDGCVCLMNLTARHHEDHRLHFPRPGHWEVRFNSDWSGYSADFGNAPLIRTAAAPVNGGAAGRLTLPPYAFVILSQE